MLVNSLVHTWLRSNILLPLWQSSTGEGFYVGTIAVAAVVQYYRSKHRLNCKKIVKFCCTAIQQNAESFNATVLGLALCLLGFLPLKLNVSGKAI